MSNLTHPCMKELESVVHNQMDLFGYGIVDRENHGHIEELFEKVKQV